MSPRRRLGARWALLAGTGAAASASLGLLVLGCVFVAAAGPWDTLSLRTRAFQQALAAAPAAQRSVVATVDYATFENAFVNPFPASALRVAQGELATRLAARQVPIDTATAWSGLTSSYATVSGAGPHAVVGSCQPPQMEVLYRGSLGRYARLAAGRLPGAQPASGAVVTVPVAVTTATAARFGLRPGSHLAMGGVVLAVTGILRPLSPASTFWTLDPDALAPTRNGCGPAAAATYWLGAAFTSAAELPVVQTQTDTAQMVLTWDYPLRLGPLSASQAPALTDELTSSLTEAGLVTAATRGQPTLVSVTSGLASVVAAFVGEDHAVGSVLGLFFVSLTIMGAAVVALGTLLVAGHRRGEFTVMRARGASLRQVAAAAAGAAAAVCLPAAVVGMTLAVAVTPGGGSPLPWGLAGAVLLVALAGLPLAAVWPQRSRRVSQPGRGRRRAGRRLVAEASAVALAAGSLLVLRAQGTGTAGGDLYARAVPVLIAAPVAILVMRCYPLVVRSLLRLAGTRRGVTSYVGLARAGDGMATAVLPVFALILGLAVVDFGAMVHAAVARGQVAASWQRTGADGLVDAANSVLPMGAPVQHTLASVPGVQRSTAVAVLAGTPASSAPLAVAVVSPARYAAFLAATPAPPFPARLLTKPSHAPRGAIPALATPTAAVQLGRGSAGVGVGLSTVTVRVVGRVPSVPGVTGPAVLVLPAWAFGHAPPTPTLMLLAGTGLDGTRLVSLAARELPGSAVTLRARVLAGLTGAPLPHGGGVALAWGAVAAASFAMLVLVVALVLTARSRELTVARLAAMGLSARQARWLVAAEALPLVVAAVVGGTVAAWVLAVVVGPAVSLAPLTGTVAAVPVRPQALPLAVAVVGLVSLAVAALVAQTVIASRRGAARSLRME